MLEHSKAASVIAVSALERRTRIFDGERVSREPEPISPPLTHFSLPASAGLAAIANITKTWPQRVCVV